MNSDRAAGPLLPQQTPTYQSKERTMIRNGNYRTVSGELVRLERTESGGYRIVFGDGRESFIGGTK